MKIEAQKFEGPIDVGGSLALLRARVFVRAGTIVAVRQLELLDIAGKALPRFDVGTIFEAQDGTLSEEDPG
jgi:hypothetical protein